MDLEGLLGRPGIGYRAWRIVPSVHACEQGVKLELYSICIAFSRVFRVTSLSLPIGHSGTFVFTAQTVFHAAGGGVHLGILT